MKKLNNYKKLIIILICFIVVFIGFVSYAIILMQNPIKITEISVLQVEFCIDQNKYMVILPKEEVEINDSEKVTNILPANENSTQNKTTPKQKSSVTVSPTTYIPKIQIPRTKINYEIYSDMSVKNMEKGVVILCTDNGLNQPGNTVISGHNYGNGKLFSNNHKIQEGDLIYITDSSGQKLTYSVYSKYYTNPNDASYIERDTQGAIEISLTTCTLDSSQRIIILARQI